MAADRSDFLLHMYDALWANINRHILVVWESVAAVLGGAALSGFVARGVVGIDLATATFLVLDGWLLGHILDASAWFNRNLHIIGNIERDFLADADEQRIHPYFVDRRRNTVVEHFKLQIALSLGLALIALGNHFLTRVWPSFFYQHRQLDVRRTLPYIVVTVAGVLLWRLRKTLTTQFDDLNARSPGAGRSPAPDAGHPKRRRRLPTQSR